MSPVTRAMKRRGGARIETPTLGPGSRRLSSHSVSSVDSEWLEQLRPSRAANRSKLKTINHRSSEEEDPEPMSNPQPPGFSNLPEPNPALFRSPVTLKSGSRNRPEYTSDVALSMHDYRQTHLIPNGVIYEPDGVLLPAHIAALWRTIKTPREVSADEPKGKTLQENMEVLEKLQVEGAWGRQLRDVAMGVGLLPHTVMLHRLGLEELGLAEDMPFDQSIIPKSSWYENQDIPIPRTAVVYGLKDCPKSSRKHDVQIRNSLEPVGGLFSPYCNISFPFFVAAVEGWGLDQESLYTCFNQSLGAATSCVKIIDNLNKQVEDSPHMQIGGDPVDNTIFSLVMDQLTATLQVSWSQDGKKYYTKILERFCLWEERGYVSLWRCVQGILRWGAGDRLSEIRKVLKMIPGLNRYGYSPRSPTQNSSSSFSPSV